MHHQHQTQTAGPNRIQVNQGDVLVCQCGDCNVELTVSKSCSTTACGTTCEIEVSCCGSPMTKKAS